MMVFHFQHRGVAQSGSALVWGASGRRFKSGRPDQSFKLISRGIAAGFYSSYATKQWNKELAIVEKIWLKSYPPGVPAEINADAYQSLVEVFEKSCQDYPNNPAFYNLGVTLTYGQLEKYTRDFAAYLQQELNLKKGSRLAIMLPNTLQYPIAMFGALRAGLIVVNVNPLYTADELAYQLKDAGAETLVAISNFASTVEKALPHMPTVKNVIITDLGDLFPAIKAWVTNLVLKYFYKKIPAWHMPHAILFKHMLA